MSQLRDPPAIAERPAALPPRQAGVVIVVVAFGVYVVSASWPHSPVSWTRVAAAVLYLLAGIVAQSRRPDNRTWLFLIAAAVGLFVEHGALGWTSSPAVLALLTDLGTPLILTMGLAFPWGRFTRPAAALVVVEWSTALLGPLFAWLVGPGPTATAVTIGSDVVEGVVVAATMAVLVRRYHRATPPLRRALRPSYLVGAGCLLIGLTVLVASGATHDQLNLALGILKLLLPIAFLVGLLGLKQDLAGAIVSRMAAAGDLEGVVQQALGDRSARLLLGNDDLPTPGQLTVPLEFEGTRLGRLAHDPALADDPTALRSVAAVVSLTLHHQQLQAQIVSRTAELTAAAGRLVKATDAARRQIERNLHDGAQQQLVAVTIELRLLESELTGRGSADDASSVGTAAEHLENALAELRILARGLQPAPLHDRDLATALATLAERAPLPVTVTVDDDPTVAVPITEALWFAAAEGLTNIARHAGATSADLRLRIAVDGAELTLTDNGRGISGPEGTGLSGLRDRIRALHGEVEVASAEPHGTRLTVRVPR